MKFGLKEEQLQSIVEVIREVEKIEKASIFGSRARGDYEKTSDIDIAIYAPEISSLELNLLRDKLEQLDIIYKIDVVDFFNISKQGLIDNIKEEGKVIYEKADYKLQIKDYSDQVSEN
ncbi:MULTISPECIES: nucleotidyltransferase domain-containing protein [unclassified Candidatus Frackibacter]|uniref:nucleotidyltransferase domain-containing protein n=1 Tax=unclassified Candidatus Frackibacter TaxID=2648818 RepID=UPI0008837CD3|nr:MULTISPECIES: nucleotidyltransferase domain-containing protein [unclassified Candidatus Frackibacter]SDC85421.1 Predicted nucleotidyltransferase [Candidatus Frackibacter sp. WG11]SEM99669.1 Predicted nucleotidyltransferase [Candidatus Frackibacter sp. WG12]SFM07738.1 Predicted nucleotidyltransferase [Candidatus Frackibacter sp. WG13]